MKPLIRFTLSQGVLVNVATVALVVLAAFWALPNLPVDRFPNFELGEVQITIRYPGASPEEVERLVTDELEDAIRGMPGIDWLRSSSIANQSSMRVKFVDDADYDALYDELRLRVLGVQNVLPTVNGEPLAPRFDVIDVDEWLPVVQVSLLPKTPGSIGKQELIQMGMELRLQLEALPGIKKVILDGDEPQQLDLALDSDAMQRHGIALHTVADALRRAGAAPPVGDLHAPDGKRLLRVDGRFRSLDEVLAVAVRRDGDGKVLRLADLIDRADTGLRPIPGTNRQSMNGRDAITCKVLKLESANAISVKAAVDAATNAFIARRGDVGIEAITTQDNTLAIADGLGVLTSNLAMSSILVALTLLLFLDRRGGARRAFAVVLGLVGAAATAVVGHWAAEMAIAGVAVLVIGSMNRASALTLSGMVFSLLGALIAFKLLGYSINELSLLGFVLVSGILVDDAIVVIENVQRHREQSEPLMQAVVDGTAEVFWPVVSATLTTVGAFLPLLLMTGTVGQFFALIPIAVCTALLISLVECLLVLPLHIVDAERVLGPDKSVHVAAPAAKDSRLLSGYLRLLEWHVRHPVLVFIGITLTFVLAVLLVRDSFVAASQGRTPLIRSKFFPEETAVVDCLVTMPQTANQDATDAVLRRMATAVAALGPGWAGSANALAGMQLDSAYQPVFGDRYGMVMVEAPPKSVRSFVNDQDMFEKVRSAALAAAEGAGAVVHVQARQGGPPTGPPLSVRLTGLDDRAIDAAHRELMEFLGAEARSGGRLEGVTSISDDRSSTTSVLSFIPDREAIALHGLDETAVADFVASTIDGAWVGDLRRLDEDTPMRLRLARQGPTRPEELLQLPIVADGERLLTASELGRFELRQEPERLVRWDYQRSITVSGQLAADSRLDATSLKLLMQGWWQGIAARHPAVAISFEGEAEDTARSYASLIASFVLAIAVIYAVLAAQFRSYLQPFLIMSNIVFAFTGVVFSLAGFGLLYLLLPEIFSPQRSWFTVNVFIAIVGLAGMVVNDAIVLIDFINGRRAAGLDALAAVRDACQQRIRPILMTSITTIAGLLPMALGIPSFSITWGPFATAFVVGLVFSTTMTLLVVPVLYLTLQRLISTEKPAVPRETA